jgi:hypothetical protein
MAVVVVVIITLCVQDSMVVVVVVHQVQGQGKDKHMVEVFILDRHM